MSKPIAILGRGTSLRRYIRFAHLYDQIYLVNPFTAEIEKLGRKFFQGKEVVHVISHGNDCRLRKEQYELFSKFIITANMTKGTPPAPAMKNFPATQSLGSVSYVHFQRMAESMRDRGFPLIGWHEIATILHTEGDGESHLTHDELLVQLETEFSDVISANNERATSSIRCWPTTGMFAIELALTTEKPEEIHLFGFDCFRNGSDSYFIGRRKSHQNKDAQKVMRYYLRHLVREFSATAFRSADDQPDIIESNWEMLQ